MIKITRKEEAELLRKRAAKGRRKIVGPKLRARVRQAPAINEDAAYMGWLHQGLPCIACIRLGPAPRDTHIEAAHQKLNVASKGWAKTAGRRGPHRRCLPLCAFHHRTGTPCCDPAQAKFWSIVGVELEQVIELTEALFAAYQQDLPGAAIIRQYARHGLDDRGQGRSRSVEGVRVND